MKCHIGVDAGSGLVHTMTVTAANKHDITEAVNLLREDDEVVYGDSGYLGVQKRPEIKSDERFSQIEFRINRRPSRLPHVSDNAIDWERYIENRKTDTHEIVSIGLSVSVRLRFPLPICSQNATRNRERAPETQ